MKKLYDYLKPQIAIPVHGEPMYIVEHKKLAEEWGAGMSIIVEEGDVLELNDGDPEILNLSDDRLGHLRIVHLERIDE